MIKSPKLYFNDTGLMSYILKYKDPDSLSAGPVSGAIFETFLFNEFLKYKYNHDAVFELYFYRDSNGNETDVIIEFAGRYLLFEIKSSHTVRIEHTRSMKKLLSCLTGSKGYLLGFYKDDLQISENISAVNWKSMFKILDENFGLQ